MQNHRQNAVTRNASGSSPPTTNVELMSLVYRDARLLDGTEHTVVDPDLRGKNRGESIPGPSTVHATSGLLVSRAVETWDPDMLATASALLHLADHNDMVALDTAWTALALSGLAYRCLFYGALVRLLTEDVLAFRAHGIHVAHLRERVASSEVGSELAPPRAPLMKRAA